MTCDILYTIVPMEQIFPSRSDEARPGFIEASVGGVRLSLRLIPGGDPIVERLLSTKPADYLNPALAPGSSVKI